MENKEVKYIDIEIGKDEIELIKLEVDKVLEIYLDDISYDVDVEYEV